MSAPTIVPVHGAFADRNIPVAAQRFVAERAGAVSVEVAASHAVSVSRPDAVAELIGTAVAAVR